MYGPLLQDTDGLQEFKIFLTENALPTRQNHKANESDTGCGAACCDRCIGESDGRATRSATLGCNANSTAPVNKQRAEQRRETTLPSRRPTPPRCQLPQSRAHRTDQNRSPDLMAPRQATSPARQSELEAGEALQAAPISAVRPSQPTAINIDRPRACMLARTFDYTRVETLDCINFWHPRYFVVTANRGLHRGGLDSLPPGRRGRSCSWSRAPVASRIAGHRIKAKSL